MRFERNELHPAIAREMAKSIDFRERQILEKANGIRVGYVEASDELWFGTLSDGLCTQINGAWRDVDGNDWDVYLSVTKLRTINDLQYQRQNQREIIVEKLIDPKTSQKIMPKIYFFDGDGGFAKIERDENQHNTPWVEKIMEASDFELIEYLLQRFNHGVDLLLQGPYRGLPLNMSNLKQCP